MGPAGPLSLLLWTHTILAAIVFSKASPQLANWGVVRQMRQYTTNDTIGEILLRMNDVEKNVTRTESAKENISEHLAALGFHLNPNKSDLGRSQNPCEKYSQDDLEGQNEMPWTLWGNSKCVKLLSGLSTFSDATARCRQQHTKGQDIGHPAVVSFNSNSAASLLGLLRQRLDGASVWVGRPSTLLNCTEMKATNSSEEQVTWIGVDCEVLNRVVCEKPLPLSFVELAEGHLETMQRLKSLETEDADLRKRLQEVEETLRRLVGTLDQKMSITQTLEDATDVSTTSAVYAPAWELGGQTAFNVSQAMGVWRWIEVFLSDGRPYAATCEEYIFNLTGSTVERSWRWRKRSGANKSERKADLTVDTRSPHQWTHEDDWWVWTWVTTDYANWAVQMRCDNEELSSCNYLYILSRKRTLPPETLEMLRNVAEQRGFPKIHGVLVDQTSC